jgi:hypothetical protein
MERQRGCRGRPLDFIVINKNLQIHLFKLQEGGAKVKVRGIGIKARNIKVL